MTNQSVACLQRNVTPLLAAALPSAQKTGDWWFNQRHQLNPLDKKETGGMVL